MTCLKPHCLGLPCVQLQQLLDYLCEARRTGLAV